MPNQRTEYVPGMRKSDFQKHLDSLGMDRPGTISDVLRSRIAGDVVYFDGFASTDLTAARRSTRYLATEMVIDPKELRVYKKLVQIEDLEDTE